MSVHREIQVDGWRLHLEVSHQVLRLEVSEAVDDWISPALTLRGCPESYHVEIIDT